MSMSTTVNATSGTHADASSLPKSNSHSGVNDVNCVLLSILLKGLFFKDFIDCKEFEVCLRFVFDFLS